MKGQHLPAIDCNPACRSPLQRPSTRRNTPDRRASAVVSAPLHVPCPGLADAFWPIFALVLESTCGNRQLLDPEPLASSPKASDWPRDMHGELNLALLSPAALCAGLPVHSILVPMRPSVVVITQKTKQRPNPTTLLFLLHCYPPCTSYEQTCLGDAPPSYH